MLIAELFLTALGIGTLIRGRLECFGHYVVEGIAARVIGLVLVLPAPVVFAIGFQRGLENAHAGKPWNLEAYQDLIPVEGGIFGIAIVLALVIALCTGRPPVTQLNAEEEWKRLRQTGPVEADKGRPRDSFLPRD